MPTINLNEKTVKQLLASQKNWGKNYYDKKFSGFGVMIYNSGTAKYIIRYRSNGSERTHRIGCAQTRSCAAAKEEARKIKVEADKGNDPFQQKVNNRKSPKVRDLWLEYKEHHQSQKSEHSRKDQDSMWKNYIGPAIGNRLVHTIEYKDIQRFHKKITNQGKSTRANRIYELTRRLFTVAENLKWITNNPCQGIQKNPEEPRNRYLSDEELKRLLPVLRHHPNRKMANAVYLLLLTGARKNEVLQATWDMFDLRKGIWVKPSHHVKQRKEHRIPLSDEAVQLLQQIRLTTNSRYVFPQAGNPEAPIQDIKKFWRNILREAEIENLRIHDLRHSYASLLVSSGQSLPIIGQLLGHTQSSTTNYEICTSNGYTPAGSYQPRCRYLQTLTNHERK